MPLLLAPEVTAQQSDPDRRTSPAGSWLPYPRAGPGPWTPYYTLSGGMAWTSLEAPEVGRRGQRITRRGPGLMLECRNHHIANAGTRGENLGVNAAMVVAGVHRVLR